MSIRWKLFLALFLVTAGAITLVLVLAERQFLALTQQEVGKRFDAQITGLLEARAERLEQSRNFCSEFAKDEALREALRGKQSSRKPDEALLERFLQLRESMDGPGRTRAAPSRPGANARSSRAALPLMGLITADGELRPLGPPLPEHLRERRRRPSRRFAELAKNPTQEVAYVVNRQDDGDNPARGQVSEVIVTPVLETDGTLLGWFFMGRDAITRDEMMFQRAEAASGREGRMGIVVDNEWFVPGLSDEDSARLSALLDDAVWNDRKPEVVELDGDRFLLVAAALNPDSPLGRGYQVTLFPIGSLMGALERLRWEVAGLGLIAVAAGGVVALLLSKRFSRPIAALVAGTERVRRGEFEGEVEHRGKDEFGRLAKAFNAMTRDLALKERYREVLGKVSDPAVAQRLVEGELELGGEVVKAAVLFCDIRGFTAMTEGMPPAKVIELLNEHMTALTKLVYLHGGVVDKFVGDLVMALFGVPQSRGDDALRAARCALAMLAERRALDEQSGRPVEIGIGVAYGELVAGCMGSTDRLNYTVLGDRVNLASRLCNAAGPGEVLVDADLAAAVGGEFDVEKREPTHFKGFARAMAVYSLQPKSAPSGDDSGVERATGRTRVVD